MNRRTFLHRSLKVAAAAGATWFDVPRLFADVAPPTRRRFGAYPMGLQSFCLRGFGVEGALDAIQGLGLGYVELYHLHFPPTPDPVKVRQMLDACARRGLTISAHGVQTFTADHEKNEAFFRFARAAGLRLVTANPSPDSFPSLDRLVKQYDIRLAIHNHGPDATYDKIDDSLAAVKDWDRRIGFTADLGHYLRSNQDPVEAIHRLAPRLYGVHLKDVAERQKKTRSVVLGRGHLDVIGVFRALKQVGFPADGSFMLEYEENPKDPIPAITECLEIAADAIARVA
jgi:inosose dehydratase